MGNPAKSYSWSVAEAGFELRCSASRGQVLSHYLQPLLNVQLYTEPLAHILPTLTCMLSIVQMKKSRLSEMWPHPR